MKSSEIFDKMNKKSAADEVFFALSPYAAKKDKASQLQGCEALSLMGPRDRIELPTRGSEATILIFT